MDNRHRVNLTKNLLPRLRPPSWQRPGGSSSSTKQTNGAVSASANSAPPGGRAVRKGAVLARLCSSFAQSLTSMEESAEEQLGCTGGRRRTTARPRCTPHHRTPPHSPPSSTHTKPPKNTMKLGEKQRFLSFLCCQDRVFALFCRVADRPWVCAGGPGRHSCAAQTSFCEASQCGRLGLHAATRGAAATWGCSRSGRDRSLGRRAALSGPSGRAAPQCRHGRQTPLCDFTSRPASQHSGGNCTAAARPAAAAAAARQERGCCGGELCRGEAHFAMQSVGVRCGVGVRCSAEGVWRRVQGGVGAGGGGGAGGVGCGGWPVQ